MVDRETGVDNNDYKVVYGGALKAGADPERFVQGFMQVFKVPEAKARKLLALGRSITLKDKIDQATAEKYRRVMDNLGMQVHVEAASGPMPFTLVDEPEPPRAEPATTAPDAPRCPKCGSDRVRGDDCLACGIIIPRYLERQAAPGEPPPVQEAAATQTPGAEETASATPEYEESFSVARGVPIESGLNWLAEGFGYFRRNPFAWIGAILIWCIFVVLVPIIPLIGPLAVTFLGPVLMAGFFIGTDVQHEGADFQVSHLFEGFSSNVVGLIVIGVVNLLGSAVIGGVAFLLVTSSLGATDTGVGVPQGGEVLALATAFAVPLGVTLVLMLLLGMANVLAPALVALDGVGPLSAMMMSLTACLKNILPILLYVILATVILIIASIPFGLGLLVAMPVMMAATYASYRDIFYS